MAKYKRKETWDEAITWDEFISIGYDSAESFGGDGMPWSFKVNGHPVTHENNSRYLIETKTGTASMTPNDMLMILPDEIYPCPIDVFKEKHETD